MKMDATEACTICQNCGQPSNWTHDDGGCPRCGKPRGTLPIAAPAAHIERRKGQRWGYQFQDDEPLCVVLTERCEPNAWATAKHGMIFDTAWSDPSVHMTLLADAPPEPAKPIVNADGWCKACGCGNDTWGYDHLPSCPNAKSPPVQEAPAYLEERARCGYVVMSTDREAAIIAVGKHQATCAKCSDQEAPKAAPLPFSFTDKEGRDHWFAAGVERDAASRAYWSWMAEQTGKPYAGPERLPRPQLAADWAWDCLPESDR